MKNSFSFLWLFFLYQAAFSCTCIGESTVKDELKKSNFVFHAKIIDIDTFSVESKIYALYDSKTYFKSYKFEIINIYKGRIRKSITEIVTKIGNGDCGYDFILGKEYIIYAIKKNRYFIDGVKVKYFIYTDICTRTQIYNTIEVNEIRKYSCRISHRY